MSSTKTKLRPGWELVQDAFDRDIALPNYLRVADCGWCRCLTADAAVLAALSCLHPLIDDGVLKVRGGILREKTICVLCLNGSEWVVNEGGEA